MHTVNAMTLKKIKLVEKRKKEVQKQENLEIQKTNPVKKTE